MNDTNAATHFLNVDLDVLGAFERGPLLAALGDRVLVLRDDPMRGLLVLELNDRAAATLVDKVTELVALVGALSGDALQGWKAADQRIANLGIQAGAKPHAAEWTLPAQLLADLARLEMELRITVYGAGSETDDV